MAKRKLRLWTLRPCSPGTGLILNQAQWAHFEHAV